MELTTINKNLQANEVEAIQKVRADLRPFAENKNSPKAFEIDGRELIRHIRDRVQVSMEHSGAVDKNEQAGAITAVSMEVYQWLIRSKYKHITLAEITDSFRRGGSGEYETASNRIFGYGADRYMRFIKGYMDSSDREAAMKGWLKAIDQPTTEKPITDILNRSNEVMWDMCQVLFELFKVEPKAIKGTVHAPESGKYKFYHLPSLFNYLVDNFEIPFSPETKAQVKKEADKQYWEFIKKGLSKKQKEEGKLQDLIDSVKMGTNQTIEHYRDAEGLRVLFSKLIERNKHLTTLKRK
jgi:hypothetical protein